MGKLSIFAELWRFMQSQGKWWLLPLLVMIAVFSFLLVFAQSSPLAPFIYTLF